MALVTGLSVAWLKLGSATFQVPRLARPKATQRKQRQARRAADLPARECLEAVPRIGQRELC